MKKFVIRRVLLGIVILFFVSLIIYSIERSLPTSYVKGKAMAMSQKQGAKPYEELLADLNAEQTEVLVKALTNLLGFFKNYGK